jgi:hypothetical protein
MKRISLLLALATLTCVSAQVYADESHTVTPSATPASKEWVLEQLAQIQSAQGQQRTQVQQLAQAQSTLEQQLAQVQSTTVTSLTATDWTNLCPTAQSIDSATGCTPNCTGAQHAACTKLLAATELEDQTLLSSVAPTGLSVFRLTLLPTFNNTGPTFINNSLTNNVRCQTFTVRGTLLNNLNDNFLLSTSIAETQFQTNTAGVDLSVNVGTSLNLLLESAPTAGSQRLNQQYYIACLSYTTTANVATNVNMDGTLIINWS